MPLNRATIELGGSRSNALNLVASPQDAYDYIDKEIDCASVVGLTKRLRVECRTFNAATSVTPTLVNAATGAVLGTGAACAATAADYSGSNQVQTVTVTLPSSGVIKVRLRGTPSNTTHPTFVIGYLEIL
jgi:hypothetical protein